MRPPRGSRRHLHIVPTPYRLPDPLDTFEDSMSLLQEDLAGMSAAEAWAEAQQVRRALAEVLALGDRFITLPPYARISAAAWLRERLELLAMRPS
jgi:hypothetical protein